MTNIDTIREDLEWISNQYDDSASMAENSSRLYDVSCTARKLLAALSTIDPDANELATDGNAYIITKRERSLARIMHEMWHDYTDHIEENSMRLAQYRDAIRWECAERAVAWYNGPQDPLYEHEDDDEYWNESLRAAILATEPAREES